MSSAHERALASLRSEGEELSRSGCRAPPKSPAASAAPAPSRSVVFVGVGIWALAFFSVLAFLVQGGTLETLTLESVHIGSCSEPM